MSSSSNPLHVIADPPEPAVRLSAEVLDLVCETVISHADEPTRGAIAARLIQEIYDSLAWLHPDPSHHERVSFQRVLDEAQAHKARLAEPRLSPVPVEAV